MQRQCLTPWSCCRQSRSTTSQRREAPPFLAVPPPSCQRLMAFLAVPPPPVALYLFPNMLPSQFEGKMEKEEKMRRSMKVKTAPLPCVFHGLSRRLRQRLCCVFHGFSWRLRQRLRLAGFTAFDAKPLPLSRGSSGSSRDGQVSAEMCLRRYRTAPGR